MRFLTSGESHGPALVAVVEGLPARLFLASSHINLRLAKRQRGYGRGGRMLIEKDTVEILSGVRGGMTLGSPIALLIRNLDWESWRDVMDVEHLSAGREVTCPRPGHADLSGALKYGHRDIRNVLERASARETAARAAVGAVALRFLEELGIKIFSHVVRIGSVSVEDDALDFSRIEDSPLRCADLEAERRMMEEIEKAKEKGDTIGGVFEVRAKGVPAGLGSYAHWDRRLDGRLAQAVMSIPGVKGVEVGQAFLLSSLPGSQVHDGIYCNEKRGFFRETNRAGGMEGGVSNGEDIVVRGAMKPIPTLSSPLDSVNIDTKEPFPSHKERSDVCAVPSAGVVGESMVAWVLACAVREKFGGDTMEEVKERWGSYLETVRTF